MWKDDLISLINNLKPVDKEREVVNKELNKLILKKYNSNSIEDFLIKNLLNIQKSENDLIKQYESLSSQSLFELLDKSVKELVKRKDIESVDKKAINPSDVVRKLILGDFGKFLLRRKSLDEN